MEFPFRHVVSEANSCGLKVSYWSLGGKRLNYSGTFIHFTVFVLLLLRKTVQMPLIVRMAPDAAWACKTTPGAPTPHELFATGT